MPKYFKIFILLLVISITFFIWGLFPNFVFNTYSAGIYPYISIALRWVSSIFTFAIGDFLYAILILCIFYLIIKFFWRIKKTGWKKTDSIQVPIAIINTLLIFYISFKLLWGLNYSRPSISQQLNIENEKYTIKELIVLGDYFVKKTNKLKIHTQKLGKAPKYDINQLEKISTEAYLKLAKQYPLLIYRNPSLKPATSSLILSKSGIAGYYNPLSGEANLNMDLPSYTKPYVSCHEIAHQLGIAYEDEANLIGYMASSNSNDIYFQYAANYEMLKYVLNEIGMKSNDGYQLIYSQILPAVFEDFRIEREFWEKNDSSMNAYMDFTFDSFLKLNNQPKGIESYQDIVIWLWNLHKKEVRGLM